MTGMILVEGMLWMPLAFLLLSSLFRNMDGAIEEAAMMSGAGIGAIFKRITLPLMLPGFLALFLLIFIRAFEAFDIPALIGGAGDVSVLSTEIFASIRKELPSNFGQAGAFSIGLMVVVVLLLALQRRLLRESARFQTITGKGYQPRITRLGPWRPLATAILIGFFIVLLVVPVGMIIITSLIPFYDGFSYAMLDRISFANYKLVFSNVHFRVAILNTVLYGIGVASSVTLLTAACAWMSARRVRGSFILEQLTSIPLIFPAIVLGVAFMQFFLNAPFTIYGSLISLVIAATVQYLPYGMRFAHAGAIQIHPELE
jgi:iron(III) transport system permease protein